MAVLDFPDTSDSPWYNPDTGITYVWRNGAWHIASGTDTDIFVSKTGDNMTGDLTLGTDKITLDATNGEANFAGYVQINSSPTTANPGLIVFAQHNAGDLGGWIRLADVNTGIARSQWGYNLSVNDVTFDLVGADTGLRVRNSTADLQSAVDIVNIDTTDSSVKFAGTVISNSYITCSRLNAAATLLASSGNFPAVSSQIGISVNTVGAGTNSGSFIGEKGDYFFSGTGNVRGLVIDLEADNDANYVSTTDVDEEGNTVERRIYNGPTLDVKERLQNLIARLDALEADELAEDATSTLLLTTVNNLNADMAKTKAALTAIRTAANVAGTLEQLKADIVTATADI